VSEAAHTALLVYAVIFVSLLPPGTSTLVTLHLAFTTGPRMAFRFLAGVLATDQLLFLVFVSFHPHGALPPDLFLVGGLLLTLAGVALAGGLRIRRPAPVRHGESQLQRMLGHWGPVAAGALLPLTQPGYWGWWASAGAVAVLAASGGGPLVQAAAVVGFAAALGSFAVVLGRVVTSGRVHVPALIRRHGPRLFGLGLTVYGSLLVLHWMSLGGG
jgi:threonine/homoserine/homoserine lactone efflux protein